MNRTLLCNSQVLKPSEFGVKQSRSILWRVVRVFVCIFFFLSLNAENAIIYHLKPKKANKGVVQQLLFSVSKFNHNCQANYVAELPLKAALSISRTEQETNTAKAWISNSDFSEQKVKLAPMKLLVECFLLQPSNTFSVNRQLGRDLLWILIGVYRSQQLHTPFCHWAQTILCRLCQLAAPCEHGSTGMKQRRL